LVWQIEKTKPEQVWKSQVAQGNNQVRYTYTYLPKCS
jgi:hypothetical protein